MLRTRLAALNGDLETLTLAKPAWLASNVRVEQPRQVVGLQAHLNRILQSVTSSCPSSSRSIACLRRSAVLTISVPV